MSASGFDQRDGVIWLDGKFVPWADAQLHVLSHGLHYGGGVFEGERVYDGRIFKLAEHTERLHDSAHELGFEIPYSRAVLEQASREVVQRQGIIDGYVRPVAWRGSEQTSVSSAGTSVHVAVATWEWPHVFDGDAAASGIRLGTSRWRRPSAQSAPIRAKAASLYNICTLARDEAEAAGFDDALLLDYRGYLAEATGANLFLVIGGALHTPTPDCFLDGITRQTVIALAGELGIGVVERHLDPGELWRAEEIFLTGTAYEVQPVGGVDDHTYPVGNVTTRLREAYLQLVHENPAGAAETVAKLCGK